MKDFCQYYQLRDTVIGFKIVKQKLGCGNNNNNNMQFFNVGTEVRYDTQVKEVKDNKGSGPGGTRVWAWAFE